MKKSTKISNNQARNRVNDMDRGTITLLQEIPGVVYRCKYDSQWTMFFISDEIEALTGYPAREFLKNTVRSFASIIHPEDRKRVKSHVFKCVEQGQDYTLTYRVIGKNGKESWVYEKGQGILREGNNVDYLTGVILDYSVYKENELQLEFKANHDPLTGAPNRFLAKDRLLQATRLAKRNKHMVAVLFIDLNGFKKINDTFGHDAGDQLLVQVVDRLKAQLRQSDVISRLGGDEFLIILPKIRQAEQVNLVVEKICRNIERPYRLNSNEITVTASIGMALYPMDGSSADQLIKTSDARMYEHKGK